MASQINGSITKIAKKLNIPRRTVKLVVRALMQDILVTLPKEGIFRFGNLFTLKVKKLAAKKYWNNFKSEFGKVGERNTVRIKGGTALITAVNDGTHPKKDRLAKRKKEKAEKPVAEKKKKKSEAKSKKQKTKKVVAEKKTKKSEAKSKKQKTKKVAAEKKTKAKKGKKVKEEVIEPDVNDDLLIEEDLGLEDLGLEDDNDGSEISDDDDDLDGLDDLDLGDI